VVGQKNLSEEGDKEGVVKGMCGSVESKIGPTTLFRKRQSRGRGSIQTGPGMGREKGAIKKGKTTRGSWGKVQRRC